MLKRDLICIDVTFVIPLNQTALALGAHSATKFLGGHNDVIIYIFHLFFLLPALKKGAYGKILSGIKTGSSLK